MTGDIVNFRRKPLDLKAALKIIAEAGDGGIDAASAADLGRRWGWDGGRARKAFDRWAKAGTIIRTVTDCGINIRAVQPVAATEPDVEIPFKEQPDTGEALVEPEAVETYSSSLSPAQPIAVTHAFSPIRQSVEPIITRATYHWRIDVRPSSPSPGTRGERITLLDWAAYGVAIALATAAAYFSVSGMAILFPSLATPIVVMASIMEAAKIITSGWLSARWRSIFWPWRWSMIVFVCGLMAINAIGLYSQLVSAHVGHQYATADTDAEDASISAHIDAAEARLADIAGQLRQIDEIVATATKAGKTIGAQDVIRAQASHRATLEAARMQTDKEIANLRAQRAASAARGRAAEVEAAPVMYVAQLLGIRAGGEEVIRWLIALIVMCCDPLAVVLAAALGSRSRM